MLPEKRLPPMLVASCAKAALVAAAVGADTRSSSSYRLMGCGRGAACRTGRPGFPVTEEARVVLVRLRFRVHGARPGIIVLRIIDINDRPVVLDHLGEFQHVLIHRLGSRWRWRCERRNRSGCGGAGSGLLGSAGSVSSEMIRRMEARISSIDGSCWDLYHSSAQPQGPDREPGAYGTTG